MRFVGEANKLVEYNFVILPYDKALGKFECSVAWQSWEVKYWRSQIREFLSLQF